MANQEQNHQEEVLFNPNEYTEKELLKLLYRDFHTFTKDFNEYKKSNGVLDKRLTLVENHIEIERETKEELAKKADKRVRNALAIATFIFGAIEILFKLVIK